MARLELTRPIAIVTGASRRVGIGAAICRALGADGHDILFTHWQPYDGSAGVGLDPHGPEALLEELKASGIRAEALAVDLSQPDAAEIVLDATIEQLGTPRVLVNNAAHSTNDGWQALDAATLDAHYAVNVRATALLSTGFARRWGGGQGGRIINLTSGQGRGPMPGELAYVASKGAIEAFTVSLSTGVAPLGITVNAVNPGPTDTGWMTPELKSALMPKFPFGRIGQPEDVARLVSFIASDAAGWITGQIIHSEGGFIRD
jgi:3-oxoacyl-[acyl-carrier protein] reductase